MMNFDQEKCEVLLSIIYDFFQNGMMEEINNSGYKFRNFELWFMVKIFIKEVVLFEVEFIVLQEIICIIFICLDFFVL